jgi:hypothetical protein
MSDKKHELFASAVDDIPFATDGLKGVPTYFVEHIRGGIFSRGFVKLNMVENRLDAIEETIKAVHVVTIVTPSDQLRAWAKYLTEMADRNDLPTEEQLLAQLAEEQAADSVESETEGPETRA